MSYEKRRETVYTWLRDNEVDAAYVTEDADVRYLTGMPYGSVLVLFASGSCVLLPWDDILARRVADADSIIAYTEYERSLTKALPAVLKDHGVASNGRVETPAGTQVPVFRSLEEALPDAELVCRTDGIDSHIRSCRMIKDDAEVAAVRRAAEITDAIINSIETMVQNGDGLLEMDVALHIERESRRLGADGAGFETLVAGPARSFGIHAFPPYTAAPFAMNGLSIIDFGVKADGYTSDVTVTVVRGETTERQELMIRLVQEAHDMCMRTVRVGMETYEPAQSVDRLFADAGFTMPHALGHGVGLNVHEAPSVRSREADSSEIRPGMVFTIEPGLYDSEAGGVRLENDVLITETGPEVITTSRILRIP